MSIPDDPLALLVVGKKDKLDCADWLSLATYCQLLEETAIQVLEDQVAVHDRWVELIDRSVLSADPKTTYEALIVDRTARLG